MPFVGHNHCLVPLPFPTFLWPLVTEIVPLEKVTLDAVAPGRRPEHQAIRGGVITIGNFDGVHLGHAALLQEVRRIADRLGGPAVAVILDPHPATILRPDRAPVRLTWIERRAERMATLGIDKLVVCPTTQPFLRLTAEQFFVSLVREQLAAKAIVEGPNFFFGRNRGGDVATLDSLCQQSGIELRIVEPSRYGGQMVSSTRIRQLLEQGDVGEAAKLLDTPYRIRGTVVSGERRGRAIGFPTANLSQIDVLIPGPGVYGGDVIVDGTARTAAIHIGPNPTFDCDGSLKVEIHLLDYDGDLYGRQLLVDLVFRVRDIARFDSVENLVGQLNQDVETIRNRLNSLRRSQG
jgi:riboflavin kinase/FMN adenylyltransferase